MSYFPHSAVDLIVNCTIIMFDAGRQGLVVILYVTIVTEAEQISGIFVGVLKGVVNACSSVAVL